MGREEGGGFRMGNTCICRSEFESPEVDGEILVKYDASVIGDVDPYSLIGEFIRVRVTGADEYDLIADVLEI